MLGNICHFSRETCSGPQRDENVDAVCQWHEWRRFGELLVFFVIIATILCCFSWGSLLDAAGSGRLRCSSGRRGFQEAWPSFSHSPHLWRRSCQKKESLQKLVSTAHGFKIFFWDCNRISAFWMVLFYFETWDGICLCSTCGLAEELEQDSKGKEKTNLPKSACGSVSIITGLCSVNTRTVSHELFPNIVAVLPRRCFPMRQLSIFRNASFQTRREDSAG